MAVAALGIGGCLWALFGNRPSAPLAVAADATLASAPAPSRSVPNAVVQAELPKMEINQAVMVTKELDFGGPPPSIAQALLEIERRSQADDGGGRVFAVLDAYGEPTPDHKRLHISMHVSSEKPGIASLIFKRTGEVLWSSRVVPSTNTAKPTFSGTALTILIEDGAGRLLTVDGSGNPSSILEASVKELGAPLSSIWPEGEEREVTFIYSACGCPVKAKCRRSGERTVRTKEMPILFPDDPAVVKIITQLMRW